MIGAAALSAGLVVALAATARAAVTAGRRVGVVHRLAQAAGAASGPASRQPPPAAGHPPRWLAGSLAAADIGIPPAVAWRVWRLLPVGGFLLLLVLAGPLPAAGAAVAAAAAPLVVLHSRRGRSDARVEAALPGALEAVARALRSGASTRQALQEAARAAPGPLAAELTRAVTEAGRGVPLVAALEGVAERRPLPGTRLAVAALCLGIETGGAQARAVDGVAATLRDRLGVTAEVRALSSQARISALVIGLAPLGFGFFAAATDPRTSGFLLHTGAGLALLGTGLALDGVGWLWMNRLSRVAV